MAEVFDNLIQKEKRKYYEFDLRRIDTMKATKTSKEYLQLT